jgi:hypothetical protein
MTWKDLIDLSALNVAVIIGLGSMVVTWVRRANSSFSQIQGAMRDTTSSITLMRLELEGHVKLLQAELNGHSVASEETHKDIDRRLDRLETTQGWLRMGIKDS